MYSCKELNSKYNRFHKILDRIVLKLVKLNLLDYQLVWWNESLHKLKFKSDEYYQNVHFNKNSSNLICYILWFISIK